MNSNGMKRYIFLPGAPVGECSRTSHILRLLVLEDMRMLPKDTRQQRGCFTYDPIRFDKVYVFLNGKVFSVCWSVSTKQYKAIDEFFIPFCYEQDRNNWHGIIIKIE